MMSFATVAMVTPKVFLVNLVGDVHHHGDPHQLGIFDRQGYLPQLRLDLGAVDYHGVTHYLGATLAWVVAHPLGVDRQKSEKDLLEFLDWPDC